ncbi:MAG: DUF2807 domain-containing protein [Bacteroidetes bacterium]|nr:DUF2807 domain-containing protein [Bacteroidota bacterium]MBT3750607.1 DUF2807 domain-containing protein [Bacteroidota bacterium]MBT4398239.1 DUF2807 domain-containing protein [Bacteroidota bacterium]MBT4409024.1 DUF2807 domain-containing protein [Bacteroidota bacterium]MBT5428221.1 DUF2807 domain-containing protein [Bacteroidota bacterium]
MKKIAVLLLCLAATISVSAQKSKKVKAEGPVVTKERSMNDFTSIEVSAGLDVYLTQGNGISVTVETEENLHEYVKTEVKDGTLHVYKKVSFKDSKTHKVHVTMGKIETIHASSAGDVLGENTIEAGELYLNASSAGDIKLDLKAKKVIAECSSAGDIILSGKAVVLKGTASSAGDLKAGKLEVKEAEVISSSSANITVRVSDKLRAIASSVGDITYYGNPKLDKTVSSLGSVKKK